MSRRTGWLTAMLCLAALAGCAFPEIPFATPASATTIPAETPLVSPASTGTDPNDPFAQVSAEQMLATIADLTAIQPNAGWRNSASTGEAQALDYLARRLEGFTRLQAAGMRLERQSFRVYSATELRPSSLALITPAGEISLPASAMRGHRYLLPPAMRADSDGALNDLQPDPREIAGELALIRSAEDLARLASRELAAKIVLLDYAVIDRHLTGDIQRSNQMAAGLLDKNPAAVVMVTAFSDRAGASHGTFIGDLSPFTNAENQREVPVLYVRMEDLQTNGLAGWEDLARITRARLTWDADVLSPGVSGNLAAFIPGADSSRAIILGAHIDSANSPGALDDASGSAVLLEVARLLDQTGVTPPVDLALVWFGSEEIGLVGSAHFAATHQDLLDRTLGMLQVDCLTQPFPGIQASLNVVGWSAAASTRLNWPQTLSEYAAGRGVRLQPLDHPYLYSDNSMFAGYDVPNADLIFEDEAGMEAAGGFYYAGHVHSPYDDLDRVAQMQPELAHMAVAALTAALDVPQEQRTLRFSPTPDRRAVFIGSHTESLVMTPAGLIEFGMLLAQNGFDVDLLPYGQPLTPAELEGAGLVVALPVFDYPASDGAGSAYDESWSPEEVDTLRAYVEGGGLLVIANASHRLDLVYHAYEPNEDALEMNALAGLFNLEYQPDGLSEAQATTSAAHPLTDGVHALVWAKGAGLPLRLQGRTILAQTSRDESVLALVEYGPNNGQVLGLADLSLLYFAPAGSDNYHFWENLAQYARMH